MNLIEYLSKYIRQSLLKSRVQNLLLEATAKDFEKMTGCTANNYGSSIGELPIQENPELLRIRSHRFAFAINEMVAAQTDPETIRLLESLRVPTYDEYLEITEGKAGDQVKQLFALKPDLEKYRGLTLKRTHAEGYLDMISKNYPDFIQNFFFWKTKGGDQREGQEASHLYCRRHRIREVGVYQVPVA